MAAAVGVIFAFSRSGTLWDGESKNEGSTRAALSVESLQTGAAFVTTTSPASPNAHAVRSIVGEYAARGLFRGAVLLSTGDEVVEAFAGAADGVRANGPDTLFRIGSISKHIAAVAVLALAEQGALGLDDPVAKHLHDYPAGHLQRNGQSVRLSHLLNHTSGLPGAFASSDTSLIQRFLCPMLGPVSLPAVRAQPLTSTPGERYSYNNANYDHVGAIVEHTTKLDFDHWLRAHAGIYELGIVPSATERGRLAKGYLPVAGAFVEIGRAFGRNVERVSSSDVSGNMFGSARGLYAWFRDVLAGKIIGQAAVRALLEPRLEQYAYGLHIDTLQNQPRISHAGTIAGFASQLEFYPRRGAALIVLSNSDSSGVAMAALLDDLRRVLNTPGPYRAEPPSAAVMHVLATMRNLMLLGLGDHPLAFFAQLAIVSMIALALGRVRYDRGHTASNGSIGLACLMFVTTLVDTHPLLRSAVVVTGACSAALAWRATRHTTAAWPSAGQWSSLLVAAVLAVLAVSWRAPSAWAYIASVPIGLAVAGLQPDSVVQLWRANRPVVVAHSSVPNPPGA